MPPVTNSHSLTDTPTEMESESAYCVFRLKRNPTNIHRDPVTSAATSATAAAAPASAPHTSPLSEQAVNAVSRGARKPTPAASVCGSVRSKTSCASSNQRMMDAASRAALQHERGKQQQQQQKLQPQYRNGGSTTQTSLCGERLGTHVRGAAPPACAADHLTGSGAAVRSDPARDTTMRPAPRCRATRQNVQLFRAPPAPDAVSPQWAAAAEAASQPPWVCSGSASRPTAAAGSRGSVTVPLAAFVHGEASERGPTPTTRTTLTKTNHVSRDGGRFCAPAQTAGASQANGSVNQIYGTGARLETSVFSSASLDGRGTTAELLRGRRQATHDTTL